MRKELLLSFLLHIGGLSIFPLSALRTKEPSYPMNVYQVSIRSVPTPQAATQLAEKIEKKAEKKKVIKKEKGEKKKKKSSEKSAIDQGLPHKGVISTEGGNFQYSYYLDLILTRINENWRNPYEGEGGKISALVHFVIHRDGRIDRVRLEKSSRNYYFDQAAMRAVSATKNLPPLPSEFEKGWLGVFFEFEYVQ
jgi:TonB family protein